MLTFTKDIMWFAGGELKQKLTRSVQMKRCEEKKISSAQLTQNPIVGSKVVLMVIAKKKNA